MGAIRDWLGLGQQRSAAPAEILPPARAEAAPLTTRAAVAVPSAYRSIQILATAAKQLSLDAERAGTVLDNPPAIVRRPALDVPRSEWIESCIMSLAVSGDLYLKPLRVDDQVVDVPVLNPHHVHKHQDPKTRRVSYWYDGREYRADEISHVAMMRLPGALHGMGPVEAARRGLTFAHDASTHVAGWFTDSGQPTGILTTDQPLADKQALAMRNAWNGLDEDGVPLPRTANPSGIKVLGRGLHYEPLLLKPADALWLEAQNFTTLETARLFGVPASLMLVAPEGGNVQTYQNVTQEWLAFVRFTLMGYLRGIEDALTDMVPRGQQVRFNLESLLRADTLTRYQAHAIALQWMDEDEVRAIEGLPARTRQPDKEPTR